MNPIQPITPPVIAPANSPSQASAGGADFGSMLTEAVGSMDSSNKAAAGTIDSFLSGENVEVHDVVMATQRNELQFEMFLAVRNKMVQAYQEVMRMQM